MRKEDNREKYKEYDHRYYIKHRRPNSKIGKLETKISDLEAKLAGKDQRISELEEQLKNAIVPKFKIGQEIFYVAPKRQIVKAIVIGCFENGSSFDDCDKQRQQRYLS